MSLAARPEPQARRSVLALTAGLLLVGAAAGVAAGSHHDAPPAPPALQVLALAVYLTAAAALWVRVVAGRQADLLDLFEAALAPCLVLLPGDVLVVVVLVSKCVAQALRHVPPVKAAFNAAQWAAAAGVGSLVLTVLRGPGPFTSGDLPALLLALVVVTAVNVVAVHHVLRLASGSDEGRWLPASLRDSSGNAVLNVAFGIPFVALWLWEPAATPASLVVLAGLHVATSGSVSGRVASARLLGLARASSALPPGAAGADEHGARLPGFLAELRSAFDCRHVELHLLDSRLDPRPHRRPDRRLQGTTTLAVGPDGPARSEEPNGPSGLVRALLAHGEAVRVVASLAPEDELARLLAGEGRHDCLAAPVLAGDLVVGLLVTYDREGPEGFEQGETAVLAAAAAVLGGSLHSGGLLRELARSEARWRALVQDVSDLVVVTDADLRVEYASPAARSLLGVEPALLEGESLLDFVHPQDARTAAERVSEVLEGRGLGDRLELRVGCGGSWKPAEAVVTDLRKDPGVAGVVLDLRDVSDRRQMEAMRSAQTRTLERVAQGEPLEDVLREVVAMVEELVPGTSAAVVLTPGAPDRRHAVAPGLGPLATEVVADLVASVSGPPMPSTGASLQTVRDVTLDERCAQMRTQALAAGVAALVVAPFPTGSGALTLVTDGPWEPAADEVAALTAGARLAHLAVEHTRAQSALAHQASHDALTDLPNRALFLDRLGHALERCGREGTGVLVLFLDLDRFKDVNDSLGHRAGDELLRTVATRLRAVVRPGDTVARFGGDEFTILCEGVGDEQQAREVAQRLRGALEQPVAVQGSEVWVSASTGMALGLDPHEDPEVIVEKADSAMYRAKQSGDVPYQLFDDRVRIRAAGRLRMQAAMHRGLQREEFVVHYQPLVSLRSGRLVGVEALVRWQHPEEGLLGPEGFIPLAEETGLIVPLGQQVLDEACRQAETWSRSRRGEQPLSVSVNLSARQLGDPGLVPAVRRALDASGADPSTIALELTESSVMQDAPAAIGVLRALKGLGVRLYVDDFGTGYSSLSYLSSFPVDGLKVDKSFVSRIGPSDDTVAQEDDDRIVRAVVDLAHTLDLTVVAEGIETERQATRLRDLRCEVGQGYLLGRPVPAGAIPV